MDSDDPGMYGCDGADDSDVSLPPGLMQSIDQLQRPSAPVTLELWNQFVESSFPQRPQVPLAKAFKLMSEAEKAESRRSRMIWHSAMAPIGIRAMTDIHKTFMLMLRDNLYQSMPGAKAAGMINGLGHVGKSTILVHLGRRVQLSLRRDYGDQKVLPGGHLFVPVVYITFLGKTSVKGFMSQFAHFYGIPLPSRYDEAWLSHAIIEHAHHCGTVLVLVDDVHFLKMKNRATPAIWNQLKYLTNCIGATFIFAGIDCEGVGLLNESTSASNAIYSQTRNRITKFDVFPYSKLTYDQWLSVVKAFDERICLIHHEPGMLVDRAEYLLKRTRGYMGALSRLIRLSAAMAIDDGSEKITQKLMNSIKLDFGSEQGFKR